MGSNPRQRTACVLGHDMLLSWCLSSPKCINGTDKFNVGGGGNPVMG